MAPPVVLLHALRGAYGCSLVSKSAGSVHRQVRGPFSTCAVVGDLFKGRCLTRVNAEELVRELLGTATARAFNMRGRAAARGSNDFSHSLEFTAKMSVGAMIPRVGVRVGAFGAHPPISTQTRDTRLQCDRTPLVRTGRARTQDPCCATHRKGSWLSGLMGLCASRPQGRRVPELSGIVTAQCAPSRKKPHAEGHQAETAAHTTSTDTKGFSHSLALSHSTVTHAQCTAQEHVSPKSLNVVRSSFSKTVTLA